MQEKVKKLIGYIMRKQYGDLIYHQEIAEQIGERTNSREYFAVVSAAKKRLEERGRMIASVRKTGYRVVEPDEYTGQCVRRVSAGKKKIDSGVKLMEYAPVDRMTPEGLDAYNRVNDRVRILQAAVAGAKVELRLLEGRRPHPLAAPQPAREAV